MDRADLVVELMVTLRREQDGRYRADLRLRQPASAVDFDLAVGRPVALDIEALRALTVQVAAYGRALAAQLFADDLLRSAWERAATVALATRLPLQVRLDLDAEDDTLHGLIWEALTAPGGGPALARSEQVRLSRYLGTPNLAAGAPAVTSEPRALIIVASPSNLSTYGLAAVDVAGEVSRLQAALGPIPATVLASGTATRPTLAQVRAALRDGPALCALVCHGTMVDGAPYLWLERDDGTAEQVAGTELLDILAQIGAYPRLIVLGSCRSGGDSARVLPALAPQLVRAGVPAVIGAQGDVLMDAVAAALPTLLEELRRDGRVDRALAAARFAIRASPDWWRLALWMHLRDGRIWPDRTTARGPALTPHSASYEGRAFVSRYLRLTFLWAQTFERPPQRGGGAGAVTLGGEGHYAALFESISSAQGVILPDGTSLELPWPRNRRQHFWLAYLEQRPLNYVSGHEAYRQLVPLRVRLPWPLAATGLSGRAELEGFCFPHGVACALTINCTDAMGVEEAMLLAPMVRRAQLLTLETGGGPAGATIDEVAERTLAHLATLCRGPQAPRRGTDLEPFSIATVLQGAGVHPALPLTEGSPLHHLLEALTRWQVAPAEVALPALAATGIPTGTADAQAGDLLYGHARARAVWLPRRFASTQRSASLGCYHRNLVFAALQIESLGGLIRAAAARLEDGRTLNGPLRTWAQRAAGILGRLHSGGKEVTYRTLSSQRHLADNGLIAPLDRVRKEFGQTRLGEQA